MLHKVTDVDRRHPFLNWASCFMHEPGNAARDLMLSAEASRRLGLGISTGGVAILGVQHADIEAFQSVSWKSAALIKESRSGDWVALKGLLDKDHPKSAFAVLVPVSMPLLEAWLGRRRPSHLAIMQSQPVPPNGLRVDDAVPPCQTVPLVFVGKWDDKLMLHG